VSQNIVVELPVAIGLVEQSSRQRRLKPEPVPLLAPVALRVVEAGAPFLRVGDGAPAFRLGHHDVPEGERDGPLRRQSEQAVAVPGIGLPQPDQVGDGRRDVEQGHDLAVASGGEPGMGADDQERHPGRFAVQAVGADQPAMLPQVIAVIAVDDEQGAGEPRLAAERFDQLANDVVGIARGVEDTLLDRVMAGDVELGLGRAEGVVVARR
jgi:hypothetical protein